MATVMPLPRDPLPKMFANSVRPDGLKLAPANSALLSRLTANSKASPAGEIPIRRLTFTIPGAPGPIDEQGKFLQVYRKQGDGSWKMTREIYNSDLPLPLPAPAPPPKG